MKIKYLVYISILLFCGCSPKSTPVNPIPDFNFTYAAQYDSVITMGANSVYHFDFTINVLTGDISNNRLFCTITKIPSNVTITPSSMEVGEVRGGVFNINTGNLPIGTDTLIFSRSCSALGTQTGKLILRIVPPTDYAPRLAGTYDSCYDFCSPTTYHYASICSTVADTPYELKISNVKNLGAGFVVIARVSQVITIPFQTVSGYKIWGSGNYTYVSNSGLHYYEMVIDDTLVNGNDTEACIMHIQPH
jgi:hypothetical protein